MIKLNQQKIPEGWRNIKLKDIVSFLDTNRIPLSSIEREKRKGKYPYYGASGIIDYIDNYIFDGDNVLLGEDGANITDRSSPLAFIARGKYWVNNHAHVLRPKNDILIYLLSELLESLDYRQYNTGSAQPKLNRSVCENIKLVIPPLPEQNRIVEILKTWDKYLEKLDQKIKIKNSIKKGLMQNLLTGKIRLKNFSDKWQKKRLGNISSMRSGGTPKSTTSQFYDGNIPWVSITDMTSNGKYIYKTNKNLTEEGLKNCSAVIFPKGTILYAMYASIGECSIAGIDISSSQAILGIQPKKEILHSLFLYYWLTSLKEKIKLQGQQGTQSNLNAGIVKNFELFLPSFAEQSAVTDILMTADKEIETLEKQREIIKNQKKYLLNNLITGRIRLPEFV